MVAVAATVSAAGLSRWTSRRALRPLHDVAQAATRISSGDLAVRMESTQDQDLLQLAEAFNAMVVEVSARIERDQRFAADVSHELRSPLQTLTAASSVLLRRADGLDERSASAARLVAEEAARFTALVQDLLVLARAGTVATLSSTAVCDLLREACRRAAVSEDIVRVGADVGEWPLDPNRILQVVVNLLDNARRHGGGATELAADVLGDALVLTVDDAGPGVPHDEREMIFDRFGRGRSAHSRGDGDGTGLGLALVAQHVSVHGGQVEVLDRPGGVAGSGSSFPAGTADEPAEVGRTGARVPGCWLWHPRRVATALARFRFRAVPQRRPVPDGRSGRGRTRARLPGARWCHRRGRTSGA